MNGTGVNPIRWLEMNITNALNKEKKKALIKVNDGEYFCNICVVGFRGSEEIMKQHVVGKRHCKKKKHWIFDHHFDKGNSSQINTSLPLTNNCTKENQREHRPQNRSYHVEDSPNAASLGSPQKEGRFSVTSDGGTTCESTSDEMGEMNEVFQAISCDEEKRAEQLPWQVL
jgi:hypothetical protein